MAAVNQAGASLIGRALPSLTKLSAGEVAMLLDAGAAAVDVRRGRDYDRGHIPGSYSVGLGGSVSAWGGWLIARGRTIVLAGGTGSEPPAAQPPPLPIGVRPTARAPARGKEAWRP